MKAIRFASILMAFLMIAAMTGCNMVKDGNVSNNESVSESITEESKDESRSSSEQKPDYENNSENKTESSKSSEVAKTSSSSSAVTGYSSTQSNTKSSTSSETAKTSSSSSSVTGITSTTQSGIEKENAMEESFKSFIQASPNVKYMNTYDPDSHPSSDRNDWSNIKAITYDGAKLTHSRLYRRWECVKFWRYL